MAERRRFLDDDFLLELLALDQVMLLLRPLSRESLSPLPARMGIFAYPPEKVYSRHYPVVTDGAEGVSPR